MNGECTPKSGGFTLLEVVVALAIAAVALVGLFRAGSGGLFAVDTAARAQEAVQRAQSHLAAVGRDAALVEGDFTAVGDPTGAGGARERQRDRDLVRCRGRNLMGGTQRRSISGAQDAATWHRGKR